MFAHVHIDVEQRTISTSHSDLIYIPAILFELQTTHYRRLLGIYLRMLAGLLTRWLVGWLAEFLLLDEQH